VTFVLEVLFGILVTAAGIAVDIMGIIILNLKKYDLEKYWDIKFNLKIV
jgi:hypothetical protein